MILQCRCGQVMSNGHVRSRTRCMNCQTTPAIHAIAELRALIVLAITLAGEDENWATWAQMARRKLEQMEMPP